MICEGVMRRNAPRASKFEEHFEQGDIHVYEKETFHLGA